MAVGVLPQEDLFFTELADTTAQQLEYDVNSNAELRAQEMALFEGVLEGMNVFNVGELADAAVVANALLDGAVSSGFGVEGANSAQDEVQLTYLELEAAIDADFTQTIDSLSDAADEIQGDYGLQTAVGGLIASGAWEELTGSAQANAIAGAQRNYALFVWQTITPEIWMAFRFPDSNYCDDPDVGPDDTCDWEDSEGNWWQLNYTKAASSGCSLPYGYKFGPCEPVKSALREQLFGSLSAGCQENWDASCNVGVAPADVFAGENGWQNMPAWLCSEKAGSLNCTER